MSPTLFLQANKVIHGHRSQFLPEPQQKQYLSFFDNILTIGTSIHIASYVGNIWRKSFICNCADEFILKYSLQNKQVQKASFLPREKEEKPLGLTCKLSV